MYVRKIFMVALALLCSVSFTASAMQDTEFIPNCDSIVGYSVLISQDALPIPANTVLAVSQDSQLGNYQLISRELSARAKTTTKHCNYRAQEVGWGKQEVTESKFNPDALLAVA